MKIILKRILEFENVKKNEKLPLEGSTIGELTIFDNNGDNIFNCFSLENAGDSTDTPNQDKRIMPRIYNLEWSKTGVALPRDFKENREGLLLTCDSILEDFRKRRIFIHVGNYPQDTQGCVLLGYEIDSTNGIILKSNSACNAFYKIIKEHGVENFTFEIVEIVKNA